ncbi:acyltransferase family protein [Micromonospora sp. NPDC002389]|uniref:acyltransferase family protein n=1 Tax=Micromonospora sp. NPDC002389 TaxID=3154272 RepID=UPI003333B713
MTPTRSPRRHDLDWLRVLAFATLILYHVGMFYVTWDWHVKSDHMSPYLEPLMSLVNPWRLALLFFISGVALRFLLDSRGPRAVASDRIDRLLLPLGFGMLVVVMPQAYVELRAKGEIEPGLLGFFPRYLSPFESFSVVTPTWNHLWFLAYVLVYSLLLAACHTRMSRVRARMGPAAATVLRRNPWLVLVVPALPAMTYAIVLDPAFPPTHMMINDWATHAHSLTMVLLGWFAAKSATFWSAIRACLVPALLIAVGLGAALSLSSGVDTGRSGTLFTVTQEVYAWAVIASVLGLAQRFLARPSRALTYATEAVLPWYILHQSITVVLGYAFLGSTVSLWIEASVILLGTLLGCAVLHELLIRRVCWIRPLFGLKRRATPARAMSR